MKTTICPHCNGTGRVIDDKAMGLEMRKRRKAKQITGREMARLMDISAAYLSDMELGRRHWTTEMIRRFKNAL